MKQIHVKLPEALHRELRIQAAIKGETLQDYVVEAIQKRIAIDQSNMTPPSVLTEKLTGDNKTK